MFGIIFAKAWYHDLLFPMYCVFQPIDFIYFWSVQVKIFDNFFYSLSHFNTIPLPTILICRSHHFPANWIKRAMFLESRTASGQYPFAGKYFRPLIYAFLVHSVFTGSHVIHSSTYSSSTTWLLHSIKPDKSTHVKGSYLLAGNRHRAVGMPPQTIQRRP